MMSMLRLCLQVCRRVSIEDAAGVKLAAEGEGRTLKQHGGDARRTQNGRVVCRRRRQLTSDGPVISHNVTHDNARQHHYKLSSSRRHHGTIKLHTTSRNCTIAASRTSTFYWRLRLESSLFYRYCSVHLLLLLNIMQAYRQNCSSVNCDMHASSPSTLLDRPFIRPTDEDLRMCTSATTKNVFTFVRLLTKRRNTAFYAQIQRKYEKEKKLR